MIKIVKIIGLDCGHCAQKLETEISKLKGINSVSVNFVKSIIDISSSVATLYIVPSSAESVLANANTALQLS